MYDLAIIGAGAGGTACAKLAVTLNLKTVLIDKNEEFFGGTCLNLGCVPTKFLLNASKANISSASRASNFIGGKD